MEGFDFVRDVVQSIDGLSATPQYPIREERASGRELPPHTTAVGKILMAWLPRSGLRELLERRGLPRQTRRTITCKARLFQELELVRKQGYATADGEYSSGLFVSAGISLNGPVADAAWNDPAKLVELVKSAARKISRGARFLRDPFRAID